MYAWSLIVLQLNTGSFQRDKGLWKVECVSVWTPCLLFGWNLWKDMLLIDQNPLAYTHADKGTQPEWSLKRNNTIACTINQCRAACTAAGF